MKNEPLVKHAHSGIPRNPSSQLVLALCVDIVLVFEDTPADGVEESRNFVVWVFIPVTHF